MFGYLTRVLGKIRVSQVAVAKTPPIKQVRIYPESGRSPGAGNGNLLQYSGLENSMDRGAWWITVRSVTKNRTRLSKHTTQVKLAPEVLNPLKLSGVLVPTVKQEQSEPIPSLIYF